MKYKQTIIPSVTISANKNLANYIKSYYSQNLQGRSVVNKSIGITINFTSVGKNELSYGRALYAKKAAIVQCLYQLMEVAEYSNFGNRKPTDKKNVIGYLNFKGKARINGKIEYVRIAVLFKTDGKAYYNHEINIIKKVNGPGFEDSTSNTDH